MDLFDNREIAAAIWLSGALLWSIANSNIRKSLFSLVRTLFAPKLLIVYISSIAFSALVVSGMIPLLGYSDRLIKVAIIWQIVVGFSLVHQFNAVLDDEFFRNLLVRSLGATAIVEFVSGLQSFSLIWELILVAVVVILGMLQALAKERPDAIAVEKAVTSLLALFGIIVFLASVGALVVNPAIALSSSTVTEFVTPIVLNIAFVPFVYGVALVARYEDIFLRLSLFTKDSKVRSYAKRAILLRFHVKLGPLTNWSKRHMRFLSRSDVEKSLVGDKQMVS